MYPPDAPAAPPTTAPVAADPPDMAPTAAPPPAPIAPPLSTHCSVGLIPAHPKIINSEIKEIMTLQTVVVLLVFITAPPLLLESKEKKGTTRLVVFNYATLGALN